jgi:hypothetical protein
MKTKCLITVVFIFSISLFYGLTAQETISDSLRFIDPYLSQKAPGTKAELFTERIVNTPMRMHGNIVFSPDFKQAFWVDAKIIEDLKPKELK